MNPKRPDHPARTIVAPHQADDLTGLALPTQPALPNRHRWPQALITLAATATLYLPQLATGADAAKARTITASSSFQTPAKSELPSRSVLQSFLREERQASHINHFCFIKEYFPPDSDGEPASATDWMFWREGHRLDDIGLPPSGQFEPMPPIALGKMLAHEKHINLLTDVVADESRLGSSASLVTRHWVDTKMRACSKMGLHITTRPLLAAKPKP